MENKVLVITGMHRSGTSVISQWLNKCGLHLGENLLGASIGNIEGHFEDVDFINFHEEVLRSQQLSHTGLVDKSSLKLDRAAKEKLKGIIESKNQTNAHWGWKDPRTCLFLSAYRDILPTAYYLVIIRDVESIVSSLVYREFKTRDTKKRGLIDGLFWKYFKRKLLLHQHYTAYTESFLKVCIAYYDSILQHLEQLPKDYYYAVDYNFLKNNSNKVFQHLTDDWKMNLRYVDFNEVYKEKLLHKTEKIGRYIKSKEVLNKLKRQEDLLRSYITIA